jgi:phosphoglycerate dehydrogenase-like enzyme
LWVADRYMLIQRQMEAAMKLVTMRPLSAEVEQSLYASEPDLQIVTVPRDDREQLLAEVADADVLAGSFGGGSGPFFREVIAHGPRLRWVHTSSAGVDELITPEVAARDFVMTCGKGESVANLLAEHAFALLLALTRGLVAGARQPAWRPDLFRGGVTEVRGMTMGIVGLGAVGEALARRALAFDMRVIGIKAHPAPPPDGVEAVWGPEEMPRLLAESDVVVLILPNTPETEASFGAEQLRQMKESALLINVGRGQVMDGEAIERALVEGWIAGAGLDVMPTEPWPAESPLWQMDNVLITPHAAGNSPQRAGRNARVFCENFERFVQGQPLVSTVDLEAGY